MQDHLLLKILLTLAMFLNVAGIVTPSQLTHVWKPLLAGGLVAWMAFFLLVVWG